MTVAIAPVRDLARLTDARLLRTHYQDRDVVVRESWCGASCRSPASSRSGMSTVTNRWTTSSKLRTSDC